jgi:hypothetical protein
MQQAKYPFQQKHLGFGDLLCDTQDFLDSIISLASFHVFQKILINVPYLIICHGERKNKTLRNGMREFITENIISRTLQAHDQNVFHNVVSSKLIMPKGVTSEI